MFGGVCFMVNDKMCVGVVKDEMMCRIDPDIYEEALKMTGCREMDFTHRPMKGFVFVDNSGMKTKGQLQSWINRCLEYNGKARPSKKKAAKKK